jgi:hypothetical protein
MEKGLMVSISTTVAEQLSTPPAVLAPPLPGEYFKTVSCATCDEHITRQQALRCVWRRWRLVWTPAPEIRSGDLIRLGSAAIVNARVLRVNPGEEYRTGIEYQYLDSGDRAWVSFEPGGGCYVRRSGPCAKYVCQHHGREIRPGVVVCATCALYAVQMAAASLVAR